MRWHVLALSAVLGVPPAAARAFQRRLDLRPASRASDAGFQPALPHPRDPSATRPIMRDLLRGLGPAAFFERFARLAAANPPSPRDPAVVRDVLAPLDLAPGAPMTWSALDDATRSALAGGLDRVLSRLADPAQRRQHSAVTPTGWSSLAPGLGQGNYGYLVANPAARYAIKSGDPLVAEPDGALAIDLAPDDPGPERRANWLPTPAHQRFELSLRAYWPDDALLQDRWSPPAVVPAP